MDHEQEPSKRVETYRFSSLDGSKLVKLARLFSAKLSVVNDLRLWYIWLDSGGKEAR